MAISLASGFPDVLHLRRLVQFQRPWKSTIFIQSYIPRPPFTSFQKYSVFQRQIPGTPLLKALPCSLATNDEAWNALVAMWKRVNGSSAAIPDFQGQDGVEFVMATININSYLLSIRDKYLLSIQRHL